ncbi:MAG: protein kinase [Polyangiaceae bacterium]|nr:protein kinase [Polyangiaceae bacterium]
MPAFCPQDGSRLEPREDELVGASLGSYRLTRLVGRGGMGLVYQGVQPAIGSRVAIKVLALEYVESMKAIQRFFDEARAVNLIRHENIVNVLDLAQLPDGRPYMVMEYLEGRTLRAAMTTQRLPFSLAIGLMGEVLDALAAAHQHGIVHRDLKPDNVFVTPGGHARVLDFGIAKLRPDLTGDRAPTRTGTVLGTPHYLAPEQATGGQVDARTDIYSLGVMLYEIMTGTRPFEASSAFGLIRMHLSEPPAPPSTRRHGVPKELEQVALVALAKDPARRFSSAEAMKSALFAAYSRSGLAAGDVGPAACQTVPLAPQARVSGPSEPPPPCTQRIGNLPASAATVLEADAISNAPSLTPAPPLASGPGPETEAIANAPSLTPVPPLAVGRAAEADAIVSAPSLAPVPQNTIGRGPRIIGLSLLAATGCGGIVLVAATAAAGLIWWLTTNRVNVQPEPTKAPATKPHPVSKPQSAQPPSASPPQSTGNRFTFGEGGKTDVAIDVRAFDVSAFLQTARAMARQHFADAELTSFYADGIAPTGLVDLTASKDFHVVYSFRSPTRSVPPPNHPTNVDYQAVCVATVYVDAEGVRANAVEWECNAPFVPAPKCQAQQIWARAQKLGAPSGNVAASLLYGMGEDTKQPRWSLSVPPSFGDLLPDGC